MTPLQRLRVKQIRFTTHLLSGVEALFGGSRLMQHLAQWPLSAPLLNIVLGYRRTFDSLPEAVAAAQPYGEGGHKHPLYATTHMSLAATPRPSDYAAMFHIQNLITGCTRVFDLGGSVGNLFYCYDRYLQFPQDLVWYIFELPEAIELGQRIARERGERRIQFTQNWEDASGTDLLFASGSLHYFDSPVYRMVANLPDKPAHILINRSPLINGPTTATVQEGDNRWRVGCILYNRAQLIAGFESTGYRLIDSWQAAELSLRIVGKPEFSAAPFSGLYFQLKPQNSRSDGCLIPAQSAGRTVLVGNVASTVNLNHKIAPPLCGGRLRDGSPARRPISRMDSYISRVERSWKRPPRNGFPAKPVSCSSRSIPRRSATAYASSRRAAARFFPTFIPICRSMPWSA